MIDKLNAQEIEDVLKENVIGRIGCHANGQTYIVPISYAYDGRCIYIHTYEGKKIEMMRQNPQICFEVDTFKDLANWKSVIAWGTFEEIKDEDERRSALKILLNRSLPIVSSVTTHLGEDWPFQSEESIANIDGLVIKFTLHEKTGRFETLKYFE